VKGRVPMASSDLHIWIVRYELEDKRANR
jgi:hypothetical protein